ncbi:glycosyltransferase family 1 protein [Larkinella sp. VNQ87]|uniref:glycosyltransferase family 1 protein n=1 Tax=Larkinella sp. VNQ87 TaxID=3400921 RepID=UPI003C007FAF
MRHYHTGIESALPAELPKKVSSGRAGNTRKNTDQPTDLLCFSHLRWAFVYQRPQHLLTRASRHWRVWFWEEPLWDDNERLEIRAISEQLHIIIPHLRPGTDEARANTQQRLWLDELMSQYAINQYLSWYYTPMALPFTQHLQPQVTVYDCMDELSAFRGAPPQLREREARLLQRAELVFTGGHSLYESKRKHHSAAHAFPSSIDYEFFVQARTGLPDPDDQRHLAGPRLGFCGVIDERFDTELLGELAQRRPDWQFILLGPVVKIDPATLPQGPNLHYLGMKRYEDLPAYFSNWQVGLLPFAINEATRFISPTKTPEYLAAGLPVVSTPIRDVVAVYGDWEPVAIGDSAQTFETAIDTFLQNRNELNWDELDAWLTQHSWTQTWQCMHELIQNQLKLVSVPGTRLGPSASAAIVH